MTLYNRLEYDKLRVTYEIGGGPSAHSRPIPTFEPVIS